MSNPTLKAVEVLVEVGKRWKYGGLRASTGEWYMTPDLETVTNNWGSRQGFWLMTYVGDKRGRHERFEGVNGE